MAGKYIREAYLTSESVAALDGLSERFYFRLLLLVDDYGRFYANPLILRNMAFPAHGDITTKHITTWLQNCIEQGLVYKYHHEGKDYLMVPKTGQKPRSESKFPDPPENIAEHCKTLFDIEKQCSPSNTISNTISITNTNNILSENIAETESIFSFDEFWNAYGKKVGNAKCKKMYAKISEQEREKIKAHVPQYVASTPDKKYRKDPQTYLNNKCWNDEIICNVSNNMISRSSNTEFDRKNRATHPGDENAGKEFTNGF